MGISRQSPKDIHDLMFAFSVDSRGIRKWRKGCDLVSLYLPKEMVVRDGNLLHVKPTITTIDPLHGRKKDGKM